MTKISLTQVKLYYIFHTKMYKIDYEFFPLKSFENHIKTVAFIMLSAIMSANNQNKKGRVWEKF